MSISTAARAVLLALCASFALVHAWAPAPMKPGPSPEPPPWAVAEKDIVEELGKDVPWEALDDPKATLKDVLDLLQQKYKVRLSFSVNDKAFNKAFGEQKDVRDLVVGKIDGGPSSRSKLLKTILGKIDVPGGASFLVRRGSVEITTENAIREDLGLPLPRGMKEGAPLPPLVYYMEFKGEKMADACKRMAAEKGATVVIDARVKKQAATKIEATFRNSSLPTALEVMADMAGLAVARKGNVYYVTTPENAKKMASATTKGP